MTAVDQSSRRIKTPVILKAQLLLGNQVAMALFIGRGPIFILCLFFHRPPYFYSIITGLFNFITIGINGAIKAPVGSQ